MKYKLIIIIGRQKTGKSKLAGLLITLLGGHLVDEDDPTYTDEIIKENEPLPKPLIDSLRNY